MELAGRLTLAEITRCLLVNPATDMSTDEEGIPRMDSFLLKKTRELFGDNSRAALLLFDQVTTSAKQIFKDQELYDDSTKSLLKQVKHNFAANYASGSCVLMQIVFVNSNAIGNHFQEQFMEIFEIPQNVKWSNVRKFTIEIILLGLWLLMLSMFDNYRQIKRAGSQFQQLSHSDEPVMLTKFASADWWDQLATRPDSIETRTIDVINASQFPLIGATYARILVLCMKIIIPFFLSQPAIPAAPVAPRRSPRGRSPKRPCVGCQVDAKLQCSKCKKVFYCSVACQTSNWSAHQKECQ